MSNKLHTERALRAIKNDKRILMRKLGNQATNFFKVTVFNAQGFIDKSVKRWKQTQDPKGRILIDRGRGRRSIRETRVTRQRVVVQAGAFYMYFHNEGIPPQPQRQFMGNSDRLDEKALDEILDYIDERI